MFGLLKPFPPSTPLTADPGNRPWQGWLTDLRTLVNQLLTGNREGIGDPNGVEIADVGTIYRRLDGGAGSSVYVKESGAGTAAGWVAK